MWKDNYNQWKGHILFGIRRRVVPSAKLPANLKGFLRVSANKAELFSLLAECIAMECVAGKQIISTFGNTVINIITTKRIYQHHRDMYPWRSGRFGSAHKMSSLSTRSCMGSMFTTRASISQSLKLGMDKWELQVGACLVQSFAGTEDYELIKCNRKNAHHGLCTGSKANLTCTALCTWTGYCYI